MSENKPNRPVILILLSPRHEFTYRFLDALLALPGIQEHFELCSLPYSADDEHLPNFSEIAPDGIITSIAEDIYDCSELIEKCPAIVNIAPGEVTGMMTLNICEKSIAKVAVEHAVGEGFKKIVYVYTEVMLESLTKQIGHFESECEKVDIQFSAVGVMEHTLDIPIADWVRDHSAFLKQMKQLDERTLYYTHHDDRAVLLNRLARKYDLQVPKKIGILGRGNHLQVRLSDPRLSSIETPWTQLAFSAIEMLSPTWKGGLIKTVRSGQVNIKQSTSSNCTNNDMLMHQVATLIRSDACSKLTVDMLAASARISRSTLERRYRLVYEESPASTIRQIRLERACSLLETTAMTIDTVANNVGYDSTRAFFRAFELKYHMTPGKWRDDSSAL